jgi:hypothetical protein
MDLGSIGAARALAPLAPWRAMLDSVGDQRSAAADIGRDMLNGIGGSALSRGRLAPRAAPPAQAETVPHNVMAQISDLARSFFERANASGVEEATFDMHLELEQAGVSIDGRGARSMSGHSLSIDLHVDFQRGQFEVNGENVDVSRLDLAFSIEETWVTAGRAARNDADDAWPTPATPDVGQVLDDALSFTLDALAAGSSTQNHGQSRPTNPATTFLDALRTLVGTLDALTNDDTSPGSALDLADLAGQQSDAIAGLGALLSRLGGSLEEMAARRGDSPNPGPRGGAERTGQTVDAYLEKTEIRLTSLEFTRSTPPAAEASEPSALTSIAESA